MTIDEENRIKWKKIKINFDEAITIIKNQIFSNKEYVSYIDISSEECYEFIKAIETVLQELDNKDKEIEKLETENILLKNTKTMCPLMNTSGIRCELKQELDNKDKIIDLMAIKLTSFEGLEPNEFEGAKEYIKKYFENKAKEK